MAAEDYPITVTQEELETLVKRQDFAALMQREDYEGRLALSRVDARVRAVESATQALIHNSKSLPISERNITADQVTAYADTIVEYVTIELPEEDPEEV